MNSRVRRLKIIILSYRAGLWLSFTAWCALLFASLTSLIPFYYRQKEPFFKVPVVLRQGTRFTIRNDTMGKGHFNAPRGNVNERRHNGIDISAKVGAPVIAPKTGRVVFSGFHGGYGQYIIIYHPEGTETRFAHLSQMYVKTGQWVKPGTVIGLVGKTGNADARAIRPHLHFEIRQNNRALDPTPLLNVSESTG